MEILELITKFREELETKIAESGDKSISSIRRHRLEGECISLRRVIKELESMHYCTISDGTVSV